MSCDPIALEGLALGELPVTEAVQVQGHVAACAGCARELQELRTTRSLFARPAAERIAHLYPAIAERTHALGETRHHFRRFAVAATFACLAVVFSLPRLQLVSASSIVTANCGPSMSVDAPEICEDVDEISALEARFKACLIATPADAL